MERRWSQQQADACESPPPLLSALQTGQSDIAPIYKFVLTGGPCAGKTTSLDRLSTFFRCVCKRADAGSSASRLLLGRFDAVNERLTLMGCACGR